VEDKVPFLVNQVVNLGQVETFQRWKAVMIFTYDGAAGIEVAHRVIISDYFCLEKPGFSEKPGFCDRLRLLLLSGLGGFGY
jgi:hypothetical protein